jgi:hypothetical protein
MENNLMLFEKIENVIDEVTFIAFLKEISKDKMEKVQEWENTEIELFFESAADWAEESIAGLKYYNKSENIWKRVAEILYMGKIYE